MQLLQAQLLLVALAVSPSFAILNFDEDYLSHWKTMFSKKFGLGGARKEDEKPPNDVIPIEESIVDEEVVEDYEQEVEPTQRVLFQATNPPPPSPSPGGTGGTAGTGPTTTSKPKCTEPIWTEWAVELKCNEDCGACGTRVRRRHCTTAADGCPCDGDFRISEPCNIIACGYPRAACCPPYQLMYTNNTFACGPQNQDVMIEFNKFLASHPHITTTPVPRSTAPTAAPAGK